MKKTIIKIAIPFAAWVVGLPSHSVAEDHPGESIYNKWCVHCHMDAPIAPGTVKLADRKGPDFAVLVKSPGINATYIKQIVRTGLGSMPNLRSVEISDTELDALANYIVSESQAFNDSTGN